MSYDILKLAKEKNGQYEIDPAVVFPATIKRIQEVLSGDLPTEIVSKDWKGHPLRDPVVTNFLDEAEAIPSQAWEVALEPYAELSEDASDKEKVDAGLRGAALSFAESWFKRALALAVGHGIRIHIIKNLDYRRV